MTRRGWAALAAGVGLLLALHAALVLPAHRILLSDSTGYLADARWLVHRAGSTWQGPSSFYHPGWSVIVAPLYLLLRVPRDVQLGALVLNALLSVALLPTAYLLARRVFRMAPGIAAAAAVVASVYPAVLLLAGYEWGEALWQLTFVLFVLSADWVVRTRSPWAGVATGATATALYAIHPRGLGIVAVAFLFLLLRRNRAGLATVVVLFLLTRFVNHELLHAIYSPTSAAIEGDVLHRIFHLHLLWGALKATIGQLWYLTVATYGLVPLGFLWLLTTRRFPRRVARLTVVACIATLAASALEMADGTRVDHMVYGRYNEGLAPVLLIAGVAALVAWRRALPYLFLAVGWSATLLAVVLVAVRGGDKFTGDVSPLNVSSILVWRHSVSQVDVARITVLTLIVTFVVFAVARWRALAGAGLVAVVFLASAAQVQAHTLDPFNRFWQGVTQVGDVARAADAPVSYDMAAYDSEAANFYQFKLSDRRFRFFDSRHERPPSDLVIASPSWSYAGATLVYAETGPVYHQALWVLPGATHDRLQAKGWLIDGDPSPHAKVDVDPPARMKAGTTSSLRVHLRHTGSDGPWVPDDTLSDFGGVVRVVARWDDGTQQSGQLDHIVQPGHAAASTVLLTAPAGRGRHRLVIELQQLGGRAWGSRSFTVDVR